MVCLLAYPFQQKPPAPLFPEENVKDLQEVPTEVLKAIQVEPVSHVDEVLRKALILDDPENFLVRREPDLSRSLYPSDPTVPPASSEIVAH